MVLTQPEAAYLSKGGKRRSLEKARTELFDRTLALGVTAPGVLQVEQAPELIIRRRASEASVSRDQVLAYQQYLSRARAAHPDKGSSVGDAVYVRLAGPLYPPTLVPNTPQTERRRDELRPRVDPSHDIVPGRGPLAGAHQAVDHRDHPQT